MPRRFAILSDMHVHVDGTATPAFAAMVARVAESRPDLVVLGGDSTSGHVDDGVPPETVARWWSGLAAALAPLRAAGIPVLPIAGNHDYYTPAQQQGYLAAWADLATRSGALSLRGKPPLYYSLDLDGLHLSLVHVIDQNIEAPVADWLRKDLAAAASAQLRLVVGHVPLASAVGHTNDSFRRSLGGLLAAGGAAAYFCGHEHVAWDQDVDVGGRTLRQVIVGTAGASYTFPLRADLVATCCAGDVGKMPHSGCEFEIDPATCKQKEQAALVMVDVDGANYQVRFLALDDDDQLVPFAADDQAGAAAADDDGACDDDGDVGDVRWLQGALNHVLGANLAVDGLYGPATRDAVTRFQESADLDADGIAGPLTRSALAARLKG
jgi:3',5'-cyclic AMP phosphodiesterase CpdA